MRVGLGLVAAAVVIALVVVLALPSRTSRLAGAKRGTHASLRVNARVGLGSGRPIPVPRSFLGISAEYWTIPIWGRQVGTLRRVFALLSPMGPVRLRIGGDSADRARWSPRREQPEWVFELTPAWLRQTGAIVRETGAQLLLDLNMMSSTPRLAARWAGTAIAALPKGSIRAFEIGNEPDIYNRSSWQHMTAGPGAPPLPETITAATYARAFTAYADAVARVAQGIPLLAPALAEPQKNAYWVRELLAVPHPKLAGITAHRYPYSACARHSAPTFPSVPRVLSENATAGMGRTALDLEHMSDRSKLPLWLTEINSVTCGGVRGVSNTFATALWAPDALFELLRAGTEAVFVHVRPPLVNMAFSLTRTGLTPRPLLYGLALFTRMLGPGAKLIPLHVTASPALHLKAWAVRLNGGLMHVLLINKGSRSVRVRLRVPHAGPATIQRLTAPKVTSTAGVKLDDQHLTSAGTWSGRPRTISIGSSSSGYFIRVQRHSAALVTLHS